MVVTLEALWAGLATCYCWPIFHCFAAAGPRLWNSLSAGLRQTDICYEQFMQLLKTFIIRSTCNSRDTLLVEALIYRLRGHNVGLWRKSRLIRYIRADITTYIAYISPDIANQPALQILRNWY